MYVRVWFELVKQNTFGHAYNIQVKNPRKAELRKRTYPMAVNSEALMTVIRADASKAPEQNRHCGMS